MVFQTYLNKSAATRAATGISKSKMVSTSLIRGFQLLLVVLSTLTAVAIVATGGHVYHLYKTQQANYNPWWLPVWAGHFDTTGVKTTIGTAAGVLLLNLVFMAMSFIPRFKAVPKAGAFAAGGISLPCILLAIAALVVSTEINHRQNADTIQTWACRWKGTPGGNDTPNYLSDGDFESICTGSEFAYWGMIAVLSLQATLFASSLAQWFSGKSNEQSIPNEKASEEYVPS